MFFEVFLWRLGDGAVRRIALVTASVLALTVSANAADLYPAGGSFGGLKDEPALGTPWTGFYAGVNRGWGWGSATVSETPFGATAIADVTPQLLKTSPEGAIFGAQIGYNYQIGRWVLGVEGDFDGASLSDTKAAIFPSMTPVAAASLATNGFTDTDRVDWLASVRGRLGTAFGTPWGEVLLYATGGAAWEQVKTSSMISANTASGVYGQSAAGTTTNTRSGLVAGAGIEYPLAPGWSFRGEYLFYDFGSRSTAGLPIANCAIPGCGVHVTTGTDSISVIRFGVNYNFNSTYGSLKDVPLGGLKDAPAIAASWTGFYAGGNGGWGWTDLTASETPFGVSAIADITPRSLKLSPQGAIFGGQAGYNYQLDRWVLGVEGDLESASLNDIKAVVFPSLLRGGAPNFATSGFFATENVEWLASLRGRLGVTWGPALLYVTGGPAWEQVKTSAMISANTAVNVYGQSAAGATTNTKSGYAAGAGIEWKVSPSWSVRGEYLFYDFAGSSTNALQIANCAVAGCGVNVTTGHDSVSTVRVGLNYHLFPGYEPLK